jgi:hypothetical protein
MEDIEQHERRDRNGEETPTKGDGERRLAHIAVSNMPQLVQQNSLESVKLTVNKDIVKSLPQAYVLLLSKAKSHTGWPIAGQTGIVPNELESLRSQAWRILKCLPDVALHLVQ